MDFLELARARYSCRKLTNAPVVAEKLERILEAARVAPTAKNLQPYRLFLLESPEAVAKVHEITPCIFGADCFLMVAAVPSEGWVREFDRKNFAEIDAAIVATHIMLAIEAEGLGSTWVGHFDAPRAKELFPEMAAYELIALFPIGEKAAEAHPAHLHEKRAPRSERLERLWMRERATFALAQMTVAEQPELNLKKMEEQMREARERFRAELILFPETCMAEFSRGMTREDRYALAETRDGNFVRAVRELAARYEIWTVFGFYERAETPDSENRSYNSVLVLDDAGEIRAHYRKTHLYDAFGYRESDDYLRGDCLFAPIESPFGKLGLFVCYELRFPEVARAERAAGAEILLMPSAWVKGDLKSEHFSTLLKARAVENTCYLLAANQYSKIRMGESAAVDPMGVVIANAGEGERVVPVYLEAARLREVRKKLPSFEDRRGELY